MLPERISSNKITTRDNEIWMKCESPSYGNYRRLAPIRIFPLILLSACVADNSTAAGSRAKSSEFVEQIPTELPSLGTTELALEAPHTISQRILDDAGVFLFLSYGPTESLSSTYLFSFTNLNPRSRGCSKVPPLYALVSLGSGTEEQIIEAGHRVLGDAGTSYKVEAGETITLPIVVSGNDILPQRLELSLQLWGVESAVPLAEEKRGSHQPDKETLCCGRFQKGEDFRCRICRYGPALGNKSLKTRVWPF